MSDTQVPERTLLTTCSGTRCRYVCEFVRKSAGFIEQIVGDVTIVGKIKRE